MKVALLAISLLALCLQAAPAAAAELLVSSAISLREAFLDLGARFERQHPGDKVIFNFGASGHLAQQIERSAPADVFVSASFLEIQRLQDKHLIQSESIRVFARNRLVVVVPPGNKKPTSLQQLSELDSLAIGNPSTVPAGKYAVEALQKAKVHSLLAAKSKLILAESVRQAMVYVQSGNVDAGIVYATDALAGKGISRAFDIPERLHESILYPLALVQGSKHVELGRAFIDLVTSLEGRSILKSKGFIPLE